MNRMRPATLIVYTCTLLTLLTWVPQSRAQNLAHAGARQPQIPPQLTRTPSRQTRTGDGDELSAILEARRRHEEARSQDVLARNRLQLLSGLLTSELPLQPGVRTSDHLVAGCELVDNTYAQIQYLGLQRVGYRYARRWLARHHYRDLSNRYAFDTEFGLRAYHDAVASPNDPTESAAGARFLVPLSRHWQSQQLSHVVLHRVEGESINILKLGALTLRNDLKLSLDSTALFGSKSAIQSWPTLSSGFGAPANASHLPHHARGVFTPPQGSFYASRALSLHGRIRVHGSVTSLQLLRGVKGVLEMQLHDPYDFMPIAQFELELAYKPDGEAQLSLGVELLRF